MVPDYKTYLAASVLNEGKLVSYRTLSRELGVHSNIAKKFLFDFHLRENAKRAESVHATYLLSGTPIKTKPLIEDNFVQQDDEDSNMQSSPFMSSSMPQQDEEEESPPETVIILVREEDLESVKARFIEISSIHIYCLGPSTIQNLQILSNCNREVYAKYANQDPLELGKQYGVIQNPRVKRRTGKRPIAAAVPQVTASTIKKASSKSQEDSKATTVGVTPAESKTSAATPVSQVEKKSQVKSEVKLQQTKGADKKSSHKHPTIKREQSDLFKSFSKPKPKVNRDDTESSAGGSPAPTSTHSQQDVSEQVDEPMRDASEDEQEDNFIADTKPPSKQFKATRTARAEQLRKMMDDEDEVMTNTAEDSQESKQINAPASQDEPATEPLVVGSGRRRGRRKVMKKKMLKDEEGYLVTKEEPAWESFSEDEPPLRKTRTPASTAPSTEKAKKAAIKPGRGNIMSFFGKK